VTINPNATTGDPKLDEIVREAAIEGVGIVRQILKDRLGLADSSYSEDYIGQTCALIVSQLIPPMLGILVKGVPLALFGDINTAAGEG
jgi:hypothetical protein